MCILKHNFTDDSKGNLFCKDCGKRPKAPKCIHSFFKWEEKNSRVNNSGNWKILQSRECKICGLEEFKMDNL